MTQATQTESPQPSSDKPEGYDPDSYRMTIGEHLEELRTRLFLGLAGFIVAAVVCFIFGERVVAIFCRPLMIALERNKLNPQIVATEVSEGFMVYLKISLICAAAIASPWLVYQIWQFVAAGLYPKERKYVTKYLPMSITLLITGMLFLYFFVLPLMLEIFLTFNIGTPSTFTTAQTATTMPATPGSIVPHLDGDPRDLKPGQMWYDQSQRRLKIFLEGEARVIPYIGNQLVTYQITLAKYIDMVVGLLISFGVAFQLPLVVLALARIGIIDVKTFQQWRRHVYFTLTIVAACIVPDVLTGMIALLVPLIALYELGILLARRAEKKQAAADAAAEAQTHAQDKGKM